MVFSPDGGLLAASWGNHVRVWRWRSSKLLGDVSAECFFFQAEDGIRDVVVTGVQTCALPICAISGHDLELGVRPLNRPEIATFPVGVDRAHKDYALRHRLPLFLGKAFGGSTALVDVGVLADPPDETLDPRINERHAPPNGLAASPWAGRVQVDAENDSVAVVEDLLSFDPHVVV